MGIALSHQSCKCDVNLSLEKCDGNYVVCEVSSKTTVPVTCQIGTLVDRSPLGENPGRQMPPKHPCRRRHRAPARRLRGLTPSFMRPARRPQAALPLKRSTTCALIVRPNPGSSARATCADPLQPKHCRQRTRDCARSPHHSGQGWPSSPASSPPSGREQAPYQYIPIYDVWICTQVHIDARGYSPVDKVNCVQ